MGVIPPRSRGAERWNFSLNGGGSTCAGQAATGGRAVWPCARQAGGGGDALAARKPSRQCVVPAVGSELHQHRHRRMRGGERLGKQAAARPRPAGRCRRCERRRALRTRTATPVHRPPAVHGWRSRCAQPAQAKGSYSHASKGCCAVRYPATVSAIRTSAGMPSPWFSLRIMASVNGRLRFSTS